MMPKKQIIGPALTPGNKTIAEKISVSEQSNNIIVSFSKFNINPICLQDTFNNHFKDYEHFGNVVFNFLGTILPKITSHSYTEICEGSLESKVLHFHSVDEEHRKIVREILEKYGFSPYTIDQMFEGNDIIEFAASLGHIYPARVVCHKVKNVFYLLFFDTNHHIYINERFIKESMFYEHCPNYLAGQCSYMPSDCFAFSYLDEVLLRESLNYSLSI